MFKINWQKGDYEIRTTEALGGGKPYVELVKTEMSNSGRKTCFTLAYFHVDRDGAELHFVGDRPFEYLAKLDLSEIWYELWMTQLILNKQVQDGEYDEN